MHFTILSLFPEYFSSPFSCSILARAQEKGLINISLTNIRDFAENKHARVDDRPYGGGPGMVLQAEPVFQAVQNAKKMEGKLIYLTPQGKPLNADMCRHYAQESHIILLAGHYRGIDQRVLDVLQPEEVSMGDFVLSNGCIPAIAFVDGVSRFIPGVLGDESSADTDSFEQNLLDHPVYTRPPVWQGQPVPQQLLEGNHEKITSYQQQQRKERTRLRRPDLCVVEEK